MLNGFLWVNGVWVYQIWVLLLWVLGVWYLIRVDSNFVELGLGLCYWFLPGLFLEEKKGLVFKEHFLLVSWLPNVTWRRCHFYFLFFFCMAFPFDFLKFSWLSNTTWRRCDFSMAFPFDFLKFSQLPHLK